MGCDDEGPSGEGPGCRVAIINIYMYNNNNFN